MGKYYKGNYDIPPAVLKIGLKAMHLPIDTRSLEICPFWASPDYKQKAKIELCLTLKQDFDILFTLFDRSTKLLPKIKNIQY